MPNGTEGYRTAEVTLGGIETNELSSQIMFLTEKLSLDDFILSGSVVDVTGHPLGKGKLYNFQWAWCSGFVAGQYV